MRSLLGFVAFVLLMSSCRPLDPCLNADEFEVKLGDTVVVTSCALNAEIYSWEIKNERVNTFLIDPKPFFSHYADTGGTTCDNFVSLIVHDAGSFRLRCYIGKLSNGTCADELTPSKTEMISARIQVRDTARNR